MLGHETALKEKAKDAVFESQAAMHGHSKLLGARCAILLALQRAFTSSFPHHRRAIPLSHDDRRSNQARNVVLSF